MGLKDLFKIIAEKQASDLHLSGGLPPMMRQNGSLEKMCDTALSNDDIIEMLKEILPVGKSSRELEEEIDFCIDIPSIGRFRTNIFNERNGTCAAFRYIPRTVKSLRELGLPDVVGTVCSMTKGLVLVTGIAGSGKSTTCSAIIDQINRERKEHIITIEDPIEFVHEHKKSIVHQREVGLHTATFLSGLRSALREDPNVILVGEMRDLETISMALTAAETGHLVLATLHSGSAVDAVTRIIDVFPSGQQEQVRIQLAESLALVMSQVLLPAVDRSGRHLACEVMIATAAVRNLIRQNEIHQIRNSMIVGSKYGMQTLGQAINLLLFEQKVAKDSVMQWLEDRKELEAENREKQATS